MSGEWPLACFIAHVKIELSLLFGRIRLVCMTSRGQNERMMALCLVLFATMHEELDG